MANYSGSPCPPGFFCLEGDEPRLCPAGTMHDTPGSSGPDDCRLCRAGYYCPNDTANTRVNWFMTFNLLCRCFRKYDVGGFILFLLYKSIYVCFFQI